MGFIASRYDSSVVVTFFNPIVIRLEPVLGWFDSNTDRPFAGLVPYGAPV